MIRQGAGAKAAHRHSRPHGRVAVHSLAPGVHAQRVLARPQGDVKVRIRRKNPLLLAGVVRHHHHGPAALAGGGWGDARGAQGALEHGWVRRQHAVVGRRGRHRLAALGGKGLLHGCTQRDKLTGSTFTLPARQIRTGLPRHAYLSLHGALLRRLCNSAVTGAIRKRVNLMVRNQTGNAFISGQRIIKRPVFNQTPGPGSSRLLIARHFPPYLETDSSAEPQTNSSAQTLLPACFVSAFPGRQGE